MENQVWRAVAWNEESRRLRFRWQWLLLRFHVVGFGVDAHYCETVEEDQRVILHDIGLSHHQGGFSYGYVSPLAVIVFFDDVVDLVDSVFEFVELLDHAGLVIVFHYCLLS